MTIIFIINVLKRQNLKLILTNQFLTLFFYLCMFSILGDSFFFSFFHPTSFKIKIHRFFYLFFNFTFSHFFLGYSTCSNNYPNAWVPEGFCTNTWTKSLQAPRQMQAVGNGDILVLESGANQVTGVFANSINMSIYY